MRCFIISCERWVDFRNFWPMFEDRYKIVSSREVIYVYQS